MNQEKSIIRARVTTPRAAAIAGILFSILLTVSLALIRISVPANPQDAGTWLSGGWKNVNLALNLLPFAGIAFLWFIGVVRDRLGQNEDRFFATVFLGSGLLFLAMLFTSAGIAGGIISLYGVTPGMLIDSGIYNFGRTVTYEIMNVYWLFLLVPAGFPAMGAPDQRIHPPGESHTIEKPGCKFNHPG